jgi:endonuclease/exonuclease/phosphatase family metal-dependent hydrolase
MGFALRRLASLRIYFNLISKVILCRDVIWHCNAAMIFIHKAHVPSHIHSAPDLVRSTCALKVARPVEGTVVLITFHVCYVTITRFSSHVAALILYLPRLFFTPLRYFPPTVLTAPVDTNTLLSQLSSQFFLLGDFNGKNYLVALTDEKVGTHSDARSKFDRIFSIE